MWRVPAKVIISGEHSVVHGYPAIAAAVNIFMKALVRPSDKFKLLFQGWESPMKFDEKVEIRIESDIPMSSGLGSSAALAVLISRILNKDIQTAHQIEEFYHGKTSSGLDVTTISNGGLIHFQKRQVRQLKQPYKLALIDSKTRKSDGTKGAITKVNSLVNRDQIMKNIGNITERLLIGYNKDLIFENHFYLQQLGVSNKEIDDIVNDCRAQGIGCKLTGAGYGGFCVAFPETEGHFQYLKNRARFVDIYV